MRTIIFLDDELTEELEKLSLDSPEIKKKTCNTCQKEKLFTEFYKEKRCKDGVRPKCKVCVEAVKKIYKEKNKEKINAKAKEHESKPEIKDRRKETRKIYKQKNKEQISLKNKLYQQENREKILARGKIYRKENREKLRLVMAKRLKTNVVFRIQHNLRARFHDALKRATVIKSESTMKLIGCSGSDLKSYLEKLFTKGMTWDNYGSDRTGEDKPYWHIDHIKPVSKFDLTDIDQQNKCFNYRNLQPLWAKDNLAKSNHYESEADE